MGKNNRSEFGDSAALFALSLRAFSVNAVFSVVKYLLSFTHHFSFSHTEG
jgi:hypothetical protein